MTQKFWVILYWFSTPKTVRKVLARPKYSAHLYEARSGFSIVTEEYLTFQIVSPSDCPKSPRETEILCTRIQGQKRILDSH